MMKDVTNTPLPSLPPRAPESHKGDYGRLLLVGGSRGMAGAMGLAGMAALRSGAGLVTLVVPQSIQATVASFEPSAMTLAVGAAQADILSVEAAHAIRDAARQATVRRGRTAFEFSGCLACHQHDDFPNAKSTQGPNLSLVTQILAKHTNRKWLPNIHPATIIKDGKPVRLNICTRCLRTQHKVTSKLPPRSS